MLRKGRNNSILSPFSSLDSRLLPASNVIPILTHTATFPLYSNIFCIVAEGPDFQVAAFFSEDYGILCGQLVAPRAVSDLGLQRRLNPIGGNYFDRSLLRIRMQSPNDVV